MLSRLRSGRTVPFICFKSKEGKMKKLNLIISIVLLMSTYCLGQNEVSLRKELDILKPFTGKTWVSESTDPSGQ